MTGTSKLLNTTYGLQLNDTEVNIVSPLLSNTNIVANGGHVHGIYSKVYTNPSANRTGNSSGGTFLSVTTGSQVWTLVNTGILAQAIVDGNTKINQNIGLRAYSDIPDTADANTLITSSYGVRIFTRNLKVGATMTNAYGLFIDSIDATGTVSGKWGIYQQGTDEKNYLGGQLGVGVTDTDGNKFRVSGNSLFSGAVTASINGTASYATTASYYGGSVTSASLATNAVAINITETEEATPHYVLLSSGVTGYNTVIADTSSLLYNPATDTLSVKNIVGTSSLSTQVYVGAVDNPTEYSLVFASSSFGGENVGLNVVDNHTLTFEAQDKRLTVPFISSSWITSSLYGTASYAGTASVLLGSIESASYAENAGTASVLLGSIESASYATTAATASSVVFTGKTDNHYPLWINNTLSNTSSISQNGTNLIIGKGGLSSLTTGTNNLAFGVNAGNTIESGDKNICIGYDVDMVNTWSMHLNLGNILYANDMDGTGTTPSSGKVGIKVSNPAIFDLEVAGNVGPATNNLYDLGSSTYKWKQIHATGISGSWYGNGTDNYYPYWSNGQLTATSEIQHTTYGGDPIGIQIGDTISGFAMPLAVSKNIVANNGYAAGMFVRLYTTPSANRTLGRSFGAAFESNAMGDKLWSGTFSNTGIQTNAIVYGSSQLKEQYGTRIYSDIATGASSSAAITSSYGIYTQTRNQKSGATITNAYGVYIDTITSTGTVTNKWGLYQAGPTETNYFAGPITANSGITGSLQGSSSYAVTASHALNTGAATDHNLLSGLQGGTTNEYYHLTSTDYIDLTNGDFTILHKHESGSWASSSLSSSYAVTSSNAITASYALNGDVTLSGTDNYIPVWYNNSLSGTSSVYATSGESIGVNSTGSINNTLVVSGSTWLFGELSSSAESYPTGGAYPSSPLGANWLHIHLPGSGSFWLLCYQ